MARVEAHFAISALALALAGCPDESKGPVFVPDQLAGRAFKDCYTFRPEVFRGPTAPLVAEHVVARCDDARTCTAEIQSNGEIVVRGEAPGATTLFVSFDHPTTHVHEEHKVRVVFEGPARGGDMLHPRMTEPSACPSR